MQHIPILHIDIVGYAKYTDSERHSVLKALQQELTQCARTFMPFGDIWSKWQRHGTGDGYYFMFDALPPHIALKYALDLDVGLTKHCASYPGLPIRLRMVLALGDVKLVGDQFDGQVLINAARFLDDSRLRAYQDQVWASQKAATVLAITNVFHLEWSNDPNNQDKSLKIKKPSWQAYTCTDKHGTVHRGMVWDRDERWQATEQAKPNQATEQAKPNQATEQAKPNQATEQAKPNQATEQAKPNKERKKKQAKLKQAKLKQAKLNMSDIPILHIDIVGYTKHSSTDQHTVQKILQKALEQCEFCIIPQVASKLIRHGTGDGYYIFFDAFSPVVALQYARDLDARLTQHATKCPDLPIQLRMVLAHGDVKWVGDQYIGEVLNDSARHLDDQGLRTYQDKVWKAQKVATALAITKGFYNACNDLQHKSSSIKELSWQTYTFKDKHDKTHEGKIWAQGEQAAEQAKPDAKKKRSLIGASLLILLLAWYFHSRIEGHRLAALKEHARYTAESAATSNDRQEYQQALATSSEALQELQRKAPKIRVPELEVQIYRALSHLTRLRLLSVKANDVQYAPDGGLIAAVLGNEIKLLKGDTGEVLQELIEHQSKIVRLDFAGPQKLISADEGGRVIVWDVATGQITLTLEATGKRVTAMVYDPPRLVVTTSDGYVWSQEPKAEVMEWNFEDRLLGLAANEDELLLVGYTEQAMLKLLVVADEPPELAPIPLQKPGDMALSRQGRWLVIVDGNRGLLHWDRAQNEVKRLSLQGTGAIEELAVSADGQMVVVILDGTAVLWDTEAAPFALELETAHAAPTKTVNSIAINPAGSLIASGTTEGRVRVRHSRDLQPFLDQQGHRSPVVKLAFHPKQRRLISVADDGTLSLWELPKNSKHYWQSGKGTFPLDLSARHVLVGEGSKAHLWDTKTDRHLDSGEQHKERVQQGRISADGRWAITSSKEGTVVLWDVERGELTEISPPPEQPGGTATIPQTNKWDYQPIKPSLEVAQAQFSEDGSLVATVSLNGRLEVYQVAEQRWLWGYDTGGTVAKTLAFHPKGRRLIVGDAAGTLHLREQAGPFGKGKQQQEGPISYIAYSPDGERILSVDEKGHKILRDSEGGEIHSLTGGLPQFTNAYFAGEQLIEATHDEKNYQITSYATTDGHELKQFGARGDIRDLTQIDQKRLVVACADGTAQVWDLELAQRIAIFEGHSEPLFKAVYRDETQELITSGQDGRIRTWQIMVQAELTERIQTIQEKGATP